MTTARRASESDAGFGRSAARGGDRRHSRQGLFGGAGRRHLRRGGPDQGRLLPSFRQQGSLRHRRGGAFRRARRRAVRRRALSPPCPIRARARSAISISARPSCTASCRSSPACSARWCRRPTRPTPPSATACDRYISEHADRLVGDLAAAKALYAPEANWTPESLALYTQAVLQGAFILAKAKHGPEIAVECLDHLRRYVEMLFGARRRADPPKGAPSDDA